MLPGSQSSTIFIYLNALALPLPALNINPAPAPSGFRHCHHPPPPHDICGGRECLSGNCKQPCASLWCIWPLVLLKQDAVLQVQNHFMASPLGQLLVLFTLF